VSLVVSLILIGVAGAVLVADPEVHVYTNERDYACPRSASLLPRRGGSEEL